MTSKERVLALLSDNKDKYLSGEKIAKELDITRNSVWKAVTSLRKAGFAVEAITNKGYRLKEEPKALSFDEITARLLPTIDRDKIHFFDEIDSTNKRAKELALAGNWSDSTVIMSKKQTAGVGRRSKVFFSPEGGAYVTFMYKAYSKDISNLSLITIAAAIAIKRAIKEVADIDVDIKWINDIFYKGKKIAGTLTESSYDMETGYFNWIIVGIGINISTKEECIPEELKGIIRSLNPDGKLNFSDSQIVAAIINNMLVSDSSIRSLLDGDSAFDKEALLAEYKESLFILGKEINVLDSEKPYKAIALDINEEGNLVIEKEAGQREVLKAGEISVRL